MVENAEKPKLLTVQILLPESVDRKLEDRAEELPGASWPEWGGHITLIPQFLPLVPEDEIVAIIEAVCAEEPPIVVEFGEPVAKQDLTRREYTIVMLSVAEVNEEAEHSPEVAGENGTGEAHAEISLTSRDADCKRLCDLRMRLLDALQGVREDLYPQVVAKPYRPHVTLAFALGENEAQQVVRALRAEPIEGEFVVEVLWLIQHGAGNPSDYTRREIRLGRPVEQRAVQGD